MSVVTQPEPPTTTTAVQIIEYGSNNPALTSRIDRTKVESLLDVGCGTGSFARWIREVNAQANLVGLTYSESEAAKARTCMNAVYTTDLNRDAVPQCGEFQWIVCSHVLEHMVDPLSVLRGLSGQLSPGGKVIVVLPNVLVYLNRLRIFRGHFKYTAGGLMDSTHYRFFDWDTAAQLVQETGLRIVERTGEGKAPLWLIRRVLPTSWSAAIDRLAIRLFPGLFSLQFVIVAERN
jgi:2-polyprenyl-3-methyl-5-hydroxy-6-metoxy-1,4-benzoquinol methylase